MKTDVEVVHGLKKLSFLTMDATGRGRMEMDLLMEEGTLGFSTNRLSG